MSVSLCIIYEDGTDYAVPVCNQSTAEGTWKGIAEEYNLEYLGRFLPIPIEPENVRQIIDESIIIRNEYLKMLKKGKTPQKDIDKEKANYDRWIDALKAAQDMKGWRAMLG